MAESAITTTTTTSRKRYVIILKCNPETDITEDKLRTDKSFSRNLRKNAVTGAIWILDESKQKTNNNENANTAILTSPIARSFFIETPRSNIKEITDQEYSFLEAVIPDRRIDVLKHLQELVKIKIYDKITVDVNPGNAAGGDVDVGGGDGSCHDCIVHYIGPLDSSKGTYFGVVFEVCELFFMLYTLRSLYVVVVKKFMFLN